MSNCRAATGAGFDLPAPPAGPIPGRRVDASTGGEQNDRIMPDKRRHRGRHPFDERLFAPAQCEPLCAAVGDLSWLLSHDYAIDSALKLVGDRYDLTARQRLAVRRSACSDASLQHRRATVVPAESLSGQRVAIDGYNLLITVESALSGGVILVGRDGCYRDLASIHGTYRKVEETIPAVSLIEDYLWAREIGDVLWLLDRPVSNSGRLKTLIGEIVAGRPAHKPRAGWSIELVNSPDARLIASHLPVATTDSVVLDRCGPWVNLAAELIDERVPDAWKVDLRDRPG